MIVTRPRFSKRFCLAACILAMASATGAVSVKAQEDPFGLGMPDDNGGGFGTGFDGGNEFGSDSGGFGGPASGAGGTSSSPAVDLPTDPLIRELRTLAGGTPQQLGLAIREAIRLKNWPEMELYLSGGRVSGLAAEDQLTVARRVGSLLLVRGLAGPDPDRADLKPEARQALQTLLDVLRKNAVDTTTLDQAIEQLGSDQRNEQLKAVRVLRAGGEDSIRRVLQAAVNEPSSTKLNRLMEVLASFGEPGFEAVELLATFGADGVRPGALRAANTLDSRRALPATLSAVAAAGSTDAERQTATQLLQGSLGGVPSKSEIEQFLARELEQAEARFEDSAPSEPGTLIWKVTDDRQSVDLVVVPGRAAAARRAAEFAEMLRRLGTLEPQVFAKAFGADLRNRLLSNNLFGSPEDQELLKNLWGGGVNQQAVISAVLKNALGSTMIGGGTADPQNTSIGDPVTAIAAIRILATIGDATAVLGSAGSRAPLVQAVSHPTPQVRYEAATAIEMLHPQTPYAGSSVVLDRWIEMSLLDNQPDAIVLMNELGKRQSIIQRLSLLGYHIREVSNVADLINTVDEGGDIELIVATSRPPDYSAIEMIDRVRRRPLGGAAPMILVDGWPAGYEQFNQRWRAANVIIAAAVEPSDNPETSDARYPISNRKVATHTAVAQLDRPIRRTLTDRETVLQLQLALNELADVNPLPPMTAADRKIYSLAGLTALSRLTDDPETSNLYDWKGREAELAEASRRSGYSEASLRILSAMGTPYSQDLLARLAINPGISWEIRQAAAKSFAESISSSGTRISRRQILGHYDRYNQSRDEQTREVVGTILDAIEARAGVTNP